MSNHNEGQVSFPMSIPIEPYFSQNYSIPVGENQLTTLVPMMRHLISRIQDIHLCRATKQAAGYTGCRSKKRQKNDPVFFYKTNT